MNKLPIYNPATEALITELPADDATSVAAKAVQARIAQVAWAKVSMAERKASKLLVDNLGFPSALAGKPIALLGVAAGAIGAIKSLEQLRGVCSHVGGMVLPLAASVPSVQEVFDTEGHCQDPHMEKMIRGVATRLLDYMQNHVCPKMTLERILRDGLPAALAEEVATGRG